MVYCCVFVGRPRIDEDGDEVLLITLHFTAVQFNSLVILERGYHIPTFLACSRKNCSDLPNSKFHEMMATASLIGYGVSN